MERHHFAFKNFKNFDEELYNELKTAVDHRIKELPCKIVGSDVSAEMVTKTRRNLRSLPIGRFVETKVQSFDEVQKEQKATSRATTTTAPTTSHRGIAP